MGSGSWTSNAFASYSTARGYTTCASTGDIVNNLSATQMFKSRGLHEDLNIKHKVRECCDSAEHPNTLPVILGLDVTGSMGDGAVKVAKALNSIMTEILKSTKDVEFSIMGIGDIECDGAPLQMSQFESDIRIAKHLDKLYFEGGGGGNAYESYTLAWYAGLHNCKLDCWNRGQKGIIITMGDEPLNPYLDKYCLDDCLVNNEQDAIDTKELYRLASEKFDIYHLSIDDSSTSYSYHARACEKTWKAVLPEDHYKVATLNDLPRVIADIINAHGNASFGTVLNEDVNPFDGKVVSW